MDTLGSTKARKTDKEGSDEGYSTGTTGAHAGRRNCPIRSRGVARTTEGLGGSARQARGRYSLAPLLLVIVFAKLAGEDTPSGIADWAASRADDLQRALHLGWVRMPHHNTVRRVLAWVVAPEELDRVVAEHLASLPNVGASSLIAFDGKTVRGTIGEAHPRGEHLLAAYLPREGIVLGQLAVGGKENEIVAAPKLLGQLDLRGKVVMGDAIAELFAPPTPTVLGNVLPDDFTRYVTTSQRHGRRERRRITVSGELKGYTRWPYLEQVFELERSRTDLRTGETETDVVHGGTSLRRTAAAAKALHDFIRDYWGIENGLHQRRDGTFREDYTRQTLGHAGHAMASLNNLAIGLLRHADFTNLAAARGACSALFNTVTYLTLERTLT